MAWAADVLLSVAFRVPDPLAFNIAECGLCVVATAAMREASHRQAFLEWAGLSRIGVIVGGALISVVLVQAVFLAAGRFFGVDVPPRPEIVARVLITMASCKGRDVCPSGNGRRMAQTAAHLVDRVIPPEPVR